MSIVGIGVDIESVDRFEKVGAERLVDRVFTSEEAKYCRSQARPARHFAVRFAAKEATVKALAGVCPNLLITQVEVYKNDGCPAPLVRLLSGAALPAEVTLTVSLSHADSHAIAFVIAEHKQP